MTAVAPMWKVLLLFLTTLWPRAKLLPSTASIVEIPLASADPSMRRWLWYATKTPRCVPLDPRAYAKTTYDGLTVPLPEWVCRAPDGGLHVNADLCRVDVEVAEAPSDKDELSWTCDYTVKLTAHTWLDEIRDLVEEGRMGLGVLRKNGEVIPGWSTLRERRPPSLLATEGRTKTCPLCGSSYTVLHGREYFSEPEVIGRPLIVNSNGLFVREDIVRSRQLRTPRGAYEPGLVKFEGSAS